MKKRRKRRNNFNKKVRINIANPGKSNNQRKEAHNIPIKSDFKTMTMKKITKIDKISKVMMMMRKMEVMIS
jgi:hypothetical protein